MMKMLIALDEERVKDDVDYTSKSLWDYIDRRFKDNCTKEVQPDGSVLYSGINDKDYFTTIMLAHMLLSRQDWFGKYCTKWIWYDNDDDESLPFQDINVLEKERKRNPLFMMN